MRKIIATLAISLDDLMEGPHGELDWIDAWDDSFDDLRRSTPDAGRHLQSDQDL
jgi:hypothetical protein